jgi:hypothetical protein
VVERSEATINPLDCNELGFVISLNNKKRPDDPAFFLFVTFWNWMRFNGLVEKLPYDKAILIFR